MCFVGSESKHNFDIAITFRHITNLSGIKSQPHHFCAQVSPSSTTQIIIAPTSPLLCNTCTIEWMNSTRDCGQRQNVSSSLLPSPFLLHVDGQHVLGFGQYEWKLCRPLSDLVHENLQHNPPKPRPYLLDRCQCPGQPWKPHIEAG